MVARTRRNQIQLWLPPTLLVDVAVAGDEDAGDDEDGEGVLVVEPEHEVVRPRVLHLGRPHQQLLHVLEGAVHGGGGGGQLDLPTNTNAVSGDKPGLL